MSFSVQWKNLLCNTNNVKNFKKIQEYLSDFKEQVLWAELALVLVFTTEKVIGAFYNQ